MTGQAQLIDVDTIPLHPNGVRLRADMLPPTVWGSNLRGILDQKAWDRLRIPVCQAAGNRCVACGVYDVRRRPDCHEHWAFHRRADGGWYQRLVELVPLCTACHDTQHIGLANIRGRLGLVRQQLARVNHWHPDEVEDDILRARMRFLALQAHDFDLDLSILAGQVHIPGYDELYIPAEARRVLGNSFRLT